MTDTISVLILFGTASPVFVLAHNYRPASYPIASSLTLVRRGRTGTNARASGVSVRPGTNYSNLDHQSRCQICMVYHRVTPATAPRPLRRRGRVGPAGRAAAAHEPSTCGGLALSLSAHRRPSSRVFRSVFAATFGRRKMHTFLWLRGCCCVGRAPSAALRRNRVDFCGMCAAFALVSVVCREGAATRVTGQYIAPATHGWSVRCHIHASLIAAAFELSFSQYTHMLCLRCLGSVVAGPATAHAVLRLFISLPDFVFGLERFVIEYSPTYPVPGQNPVLSG